MSLDAFMAELDPSVDLAVALCLVERVATCEREAERGKAKVAAADPVDRPLALMVSGHAQNDLARALADARRTIRRYRRQRRRTAAAARIPRGRGRCPSGRPRGRTARRTARGRDPDGGEPGPHPRRAT